ncbi:hypothetical protein [Shewanella surugensis]|uniref:Uncharacterized protein n=1 Tax=Shewanella surugensis TaxID=212020 RepID=A0ABT0L804_9GAMM|nr:hypothetical protein [Shewanella surugensis]MCL1123778.1 hypothetical protein [Shewanella surugensis]
MQALLGHRVIASLIIITLMANGRMFSFIGGVSFSNNLFPILFNIAWSLLLLATAVGLFLKRHWGHLLFYPAVLLTTLGFGISLVPFVPSLFPLAISFWVTLGINSVMLLIVIRLHWQAITASKLSQQRHQSSYK